MGEPVAQRVALSELHPAEEPNKVGRPTKHTPEVEAVIIKAIVSGLRPAQAARVAGIDPSTLDRWRNADAAFAERLESAATEFESQNLENVTRAGRRSWKASAWSLERRFPDRYGNRLNVAGADGGALTVRVVYEEPSETND